MNAHMDLMKAIDWTSLGRAVTDFAKGNDKSLHALTVTDYLAGADTFIAGAVVDAIIADGWVISRGNPSIEQVVIRVLPDGRISRDEAAKLFDRTPKTLSEWAAKGWGPRCIHVGGRVFHDYAECLAMARGEKPLHP